MSRTRSRAGTSYARPTKGELAAAAGKGLRDVIAPGLKVLFVGINPGLYSAATGHHFARPGNRFWPALHAGGFTPRVLSPFDEAQLLDYGLGITNLVNRATATADELAADELVRGAKRLAAKVRRFQPCIVAVLGPTAYRIAFNQPRAVLGRQDEDVAGATVWLLPNPSGLNAHHQPAHLARLFRVEGADALPIAVECDSVAALRDVVRHSDVVLFSAREAIARELAEGAIVALPMAVYPAGQALTHSVIHRARRTLSPAAERVVELIREL